MILILHNLAKRIFPVRNLFVFLSFILAIFFIYTVMGKSSELDGYLPATAALFGWFFCLYGIANGFVELPAPLLKSDRLFSRLIKRVKLFMAWLFALFFTVCSLGLVYISYSTLRLMLTNS